jgi:hypothetical protein
MRRRSSHGRSPIMAPLLSSHILSPIRNHHALVFAMVETEPEPTQQKLARKTTNIWIKLVGACKSSETLAKIKAKELQIKTRKQLFGEQYLDFIHQGAPPETLERCIALARSDIVVLKEKIASLKIRRSQIGIMAKSKIQHKPGRWDSEKKNDIIVDATEVFEAPTTSQKACM